MEYSTSLDVDQQDPLTRSEQEFLSPHSVARSLNPKVSFANFYNKHGRKDSGIVSKKIFADVTVGTASGKAPLPVR